MELYTLNSAYQRDNVVEGYKSLIWTERFAAWGDFQLVIRATHESRVLLPEGTYLALNASSRVMKIETILNKESDDGTQLLTITGRSIEALLDDRAGMATFAGLATTPKWSLTGYPGDVVRTMFRTICVDGALSPGDVIPFYHSGTLLSHGSIPEPVDQVTIGFEPDTLYNSIKKLCDVYNLGFRLVRNGDLSEIYFEVYTGDNLTSSQTALDPVIFAPDLDNLSNTSELTSTAAEKNVAYVFGKNDSVVVLAVGVDPSVSGFKRRVLLVKADDIDLPVGDTLDAALTQRGIEELSKCRKVFGFDGEVPQFGSYTYNVNYRLGDIVEERNDEGFATNMRVTEQIFVSDEQGERAYPTLTVDLVINPGSWASWDANQTWSQVPDTVFWANS